MIFDELKDKYPLFVKTANYYEENCYFFKSTLTKIKELNLDYAFAEKLCQDCYNALNKDIKKYEEVAHTLIDFSVEFLRLQLQLQKTGKYPYSSYEELEKHVYQNPDRKLKGPWYTWALYFSQIFWVTHWNVMKFFFSDFVKNNKEVGNLLEVPTGTGIFITYFLLNNPKWIGLGVDLGETSIEFTKNLLSWNHLGENRVVIIKEDIFKYEPN